MWVYGLTDSRIHIHQEHWALQCIFLNTNTPKYLHVGLCGKSHCPLELHYGTSKLASLT